MDELFCPHFWSQVIFPQMQAVIPFFSMYWQEATGLFRRIFS